MRKRKEEGKGGGQQPLITGWYGTRIFAALLVFVGGHTDMYRDDWYCTFTWFLLLLLLFLRLFTGFECNGCTC